jgi:hypothetical protein
LELQKDLEIQDWTPKRAVTESIGTVFNIGTSFLKSIDTKVVSAPLHRQFQLTMSTGLLYRKATHDIIDMVLQDSKNGGRTIVLEGKKGYGKSTTLLQVVNHFSSSNWIVVYLPQLSEWVSGIYPYESSSALYVQRELASKVLKSILDLNEPLLKDIITTDGLSLVALMKEGIQNLPKSQGILELMLETLNSTSVKRAPVLFALDQVNALFCKTAYADKESNPLTADKFQIVQSFYNLFKKSEKNTSCVITGDCSLSQIQSYYYKEIVENMPKVNTDPLDLQLEIFEPVSHIYLNSTTDKSQKEPFKANVTIPNLTGYVLPAMSLEETWPLMQFYQRTNLINNGMLV